MNLTALLLTAILLAQEAGTPMARQVDRLARWLRSPRESIREEAIAELQTVPITNALPLLISALGDSSTVVRAASATALARSQDPRVVAALRPLLKDEDDQVRAAAAWSLGHCGDRTVLPELLPVCRDDVSSVVRYRAVQSVGLLGDRRGLPAVIAALRDANTAVREQAAARALEVLADESVMDRLTPLARFEYAPTRRIVMNLLGRYGDRERAVPVLRAGGRDGDALVRAEAALSLGRRGANIGESFFRDADEHVRGAAAYAAGQAGRSAYRQELQRLLSDESAFVRAVAAEALGKPPEGFRAVELFGH